MEPKNYEARRFQKSRPLAYVARGLSLFRHQLHGLGVARPADDLHSERHGYPGRGQAVARRDSGARRRLLPCAARSARRRHRFEDHGNCRADRANLRRVARRRLRPHLPRWDCLIRHCAGARRRLLRHRTAASGPLVSAAISGRCHGHRRRRQRRRRARHAVRAMDRRDLWLARGL